VNLKFEVSFFIFSNVRCNCRALIAGWAIPLLIKGGKIDVFTPPDYIGTC